MLLHSELVSSPGAAEPKHTVVFLHGILGSGGNLRSHARKLVQDRPDTQALLLDLRAHGQSLGVEGPDTLENAARDVAQTCLALGLSVSGIVGHSFGGKVALAFAQANPDVQDVVTLDSAPGPRLDARGSEATMKVLTMLEGMRGPWPTRDAFVQEVERHGESRAVAQWLAMNLASRPDGLVFKLELPRIQTLIDDYLSVDLWPVLEAPRATRFRLVIGARSTVYLADDRARAQALEASTDGRVSVHLLDTGHWVHVEDPQGVSFVLQSIPKPLEK